MPIPWLFSRLFRAFSAFFRRIGPKHPVQKGLLLLCGAAQGRQGPADRLRMEPGRTAAQGLALFGILRQGYHNIHFIASPLPYAPAAPQIRSCAAGGGVLE